MIYHLKISSFFVFAFFLLAVGARAQHSTKRRAIAISSVFKPVLREASKINFTASPPISDTARPRLSYNIPSQYLFLTYQPGELKPVALQGDSSLEWQNVNYIKAGVGNVHLPY